MDEIATITGLASVLFIERSVKWKIIFLNFSEVYTSSREICGKESTNVRKCTHYLVWLW